MVSGKKGQWYWVVWILAALAGCKSKSEQIAVRDSVDYNLHIRPILSDRCFKCHGPDANQRKSNLRLDTPEGAYAALKDDPEGRAIVPGDPEHSEVFLRIATADTSEIMPPVKSNLKLNPEEIAYIKKWIEQGAVYKRHWAFIPPKAHPIPTVGDERWPINPIDNFVLARMEEADLSPNDPADRERLLKRASLDLTGLPPSLAMQDKFLSDESPEAYEKSVAGIFVASIPGYH